MASVVIIGAGAAGIGAVLELAERGHRVTIIEQATLGSGTSGSNPGRMGHGFHYVDVDTAIMYLRESIRVQRKFSDYLVGKNLPFDHPIRHGRYFIMKNSDNPPAQILETYQKIQAEYIRLIKEDPENQVFGPPETFFRILDPSEYKDDVTPDMVEVGIETAEHLFDWKAFTRDLKAKMLANENITLCENTEVVRIERGELDQSRFALHVKERVGAKKNVEAIIAADYVVNSSWQNIDKLNEQIGLRMVPGERTNRLKALLVVKLPPSLVDANSMFFCMGQHCMFSNLGNGYGMLTYGPATNMDVFSGVNLSAHAHQLLKGDASLEEKNKIAEAIQNGVAKYIPEMAKAGIIDVKFGIVQTTGKLVLQDLTEPNSDVHKRGYDNISEGEIGLVRNPCIKLFYFLRNGQVVADIVEDQVIATNVIRGLYKEFDALLQNVDFLKKVDLKKMVIGTVERYMASKEVTDDSLHSMLDAMGQTMVSKKALMQELTDTVPAFPPVEMNKQGVTAGFFLQFFNSNVVKGVAVVLLIAGLVALSLVTWGAAAAVLVGGTTTIGSLVTKGFFSARNAVRAPENNNHIELDSIQPTSALSAQLAGV